MLNLLVVLAACSGETPPPPAPETPPAPVAPQPKAGEIPFDFPVVTTSAAAGDFVLAPSREFLDRAFQEGGASATFIWYGANMLAPGAAESKIKSLAGTEFTLPNSLILPIPKAGTAAVGDVLLGHWESGSGLQRAIVVGGTPTEPVVRYLDLDLDNPSGIGTKEDGWKADRFVKLTPGAVGVTTACKRDGKVNHGVLVAFAKGRALTLEFAGHLYSNPASECMPLDPKPAVKAGDKVQVPNIGTYGEATVKRVDATIGRVFVELNGKEVGVAQVDVAPALDGFGAGFVGGGAGGGEGKAGKGKQPEGGEGKAGKGGKAKGGKKAP